jgi:hypothetical protein
VYKHNSTIKDLTRKGYFPFMILTVNSFGKALVEETLYCQNEKKCLQQTIDSINHVLASSIAVFISFITSNNDSARWERKVLLSLLICFILL